MFSDLKEEVEDDFWRRRSGFIFCDLHVFLLVSECSVRVLDGTFSA